MEEQNRTLSVIADDIVIATRSVRRLEYAIGLGIIAIIIGMALDADAWAWAGVVALAILRIGSIVIDHRRAKDIRLASSVISHLAKTQK